mmetsp:Transcript_33182/g.105778  ORF Transcript_33182/g.105778 Transcript_33182/m.105778 type:complete len:581 (+) Transcript_33182:116-1858(+)
MGGKLSIEAKATKAYEGQKPGTSGLRKKVTVFQQPNYLHNFVQATFNALPADELKGSVLVVSGDGRYFSPEAVQVIIKMAAGNGCKAVWVGEGSLMSTPAVSATIRERRGAGGRPYGAFILTASHNPGGPTNDFGIKYNCKNGGPAPEALTDAIYEGTKGISEYKIAADLPSVDLSRRGVTRFPGGFRVEVVDPTSSHVDLLKTIFDFKALKALVARSDFSLVYDGMHGVAGPYAQRVFVDMLGAPPSSLLNCVPKDDFGGGHPDPNLTYAKELVDVMGLGTFAPPQEPPVFGAAADGDADRNMILGRRFFVTPSDSVAVIAAYAQAAIPYFKGGLKGVARSMPTSGALDQVAKALGVELFEVPTGWKFFGNLMDAGRCSICGEESFGTGSDHVREKDGMWAVLAWLSILAFRNKGVPEGGAMVSVEQIVKEHWAQYGRNYYTRYDYEEVDAGAAKGLMAHLVAQQGDLAKLNASLGLKAGGALYVATADEFSYTDPVDGSVSSHQGVRFLFADGSRLIFRLSGTGSVGATIRMYIEKYEPEQARQGMDAAEALQPIVELGLAVSQMKKRTGRDKPTVIT